jgi:hypothetical protein
MYSVIKYQDLEFFANPYFSQDAAYKGSDHFRSELEAGHVSPVATFFPLGSRSEISWWR